jgi:hypothetical protein
MRDAKRARRIAAFWLVLGVGLCTLYQINNLPKADAQIEQIEVTRLAVSPTARPVSLPVMAEKTELPAAAPSPQSSVKPDKRPSDRTKADLVASFDRRAAWVRNTIGCSAPIDDTAVAACNCVVPILAGHITEADIANPKKKKDRRYNDMLFSTLLACRSQLHLN